MVKNIPAMWETWVQSLGKSPGGGHGNSLRFTCLEKPMDRGAWQVMGLSMGSNTNEWPSICICQKPLNSTFKDFHSILLKLQPYSIIHAFKTWQEHKQIKIMYIKFCRMICYGHSVERKQRIEKKINGKKEVKNEVTS